jgi:hypothetical protein
MSIVFDQPRILDAPKVSKVSRATKDKKKKEAAAINLLVDLDKRHKLHLGAGDRDGLIELAGEYVLIKCPNTATRILAEAERM